MEPGSPYSAERIRHSLLQVTESERFQKSPKLAELLSYLVEQTLAGRAELLKGYSIAIDVFGRNASFDPARDSIVRVHMSRLRTLLESHYSQSARTVDPMIVLQPGNYAPKFVASSQVAKPTCDPSNSPSRIVAKAFALTRERVVFAALIVALTALFLQHEMTQHSEIEDATKAAYQRPDGPSVAVAAFAVEGYETELALQLRAGLQHEIISYLSQLPNLAVLGQDTVEGREYQTAGERGSVDFVVVGAIGVDGDDFRVSASLVRTLDGTVMWSKAATSEILDAGKLLEAQSSIALSIAAELGQPYGAIQEAMRDNSPIQENVALSEYFCELKAYDYMLSKDHAVRAEVRQCLEEAIERIPRYSDALALLAMIEGEEARLVAGRDDQAAEEGMRLALALAERAVQANPSNPVAYTQRAVAQYFNGADQAAEASIERALRLSPNNTEILADAAWLYASWGDTENATALADKAIALNPSHPPWYWLGPSLVALTHGNKVEALRAAERYQQEETLHSSFVLAAALRLNSRSSAADQTLATSASLNGLTAAEWQANLAAWRLPDTVVSLALGDVASTD